MLRRWAIGDALDLAVFRIVVSVVVLGSADVWTARAWVGAAVHAPLGWRWTSGLSPSQPAADLATVLTLLGAALTLVGWKTRVVAPLTAMSLAWLLGVPQYSSQVLHTHHLVWFFGLLAVSPCSDALALDARGRPRPAPSLAYGLPVRIAWLAIGLVFFFPGAWKLLAGGAWREGLETLVAWKGFQLGQAPWLTVPSSWWPSLALAGAVVEVLIGPLLLFRRTRVAGVVLALLFHLFVQATLRISFSSLWVCYLVFIPWADWVKSATSAIAANHSAMASAVYGGLLVGALGVTGALGIDDAWPVACYPRFHRPAPRTVEWLEIKEGDRLVFSLEQLRGVDGQRWWGVVARVLHHPSRDALVAFHRQLGGTGAPSSVVRVRHDVLSGETTRVELPLE